jgi:hypothetical protein
MLNPRLSSKTALFFALVAARFFFRREFATSTSAAHKHGNARHLRAFEAEQIARVWKSALPRDPKIAAFAAVNSFHSERYLNLLPVKITLRQSLKGVLWQKKI